MTNAHYPDQATHGSSRTNERIFAAYQAHRGPVDTRA